jgi:hypothetical protein
MLARHPLLDADPHAARAMAIDRAGGIPLEVFYDPETLRLEDVFQLIYGVTALSDRFEREALGPLTKRNTARALQNLFAELAQREKTAKRDADGALLYDNVVGEPAPWTPQRPKSLADIPELSASHRMRWEQWAALDDPYAPPPPIKPPTPTATLDIPSAATAQRPGRTFLYRIEGKPGDAKAPVIRVDQYTLVKTVGMSFKTPEGLAAIYAKIIRRVAIEQYQQDTHSDPHYTAQEEAANDAGALETAKKLAATYHPPADRTAEEFANEFEKREPGSQFTIEVYPSFYMELENHMPVPQSLYSLPGKKEDKQEPMWRPMLSGASLEERVMFACRQLKFASTSGAENCYKPGSISSDGLMFLYQASADDLVYMTPDGRLLQVNERALLLEAFRQGVMSALGIVIAGYILIGATVVLLAAPAVLAEAPAAVQGAVSWALTNPAQALAAAEIGVGTAINIGENGLGNFIDSLQTPQGAAMLLMDIIMLKSSGGGGVPHPEVTEEEPPMPRLQRAGGGGFEPDEEVTSNAPPRRVAPPVDPDAAEPTTAAAPRSRIAAPDVEPEPMMHEGKPTVGRPVGLELDGDDHELIMVDDRGRISLRLCSENCGDVVAKLTAARDALPDIPENASARAQLQTLIDEGEDIMELFGTTETRGQRATWQTRVKVFGDNLQAAADAFPDEIGVTLNEPIPIPGNAAYKGPIKPNSWRLTSRGAGAHMFERANVKGRTLLTKLDQPGTPRYYPEGSPENAGQAHLRLHDATADAGIELGGSQLTDTDIIGAYQRAYSSPSLDGIRGDLRLPNGTMFAKNVTPREAFDALVKWAGL